MSKSTQSATVPSTTSAPSASRPDREPAPQALAGNAAAQEALDGVPPEDPEYRSWFQAIEAALRPQEDTGEPVGQQRTDLAGNLLFDAHEDPILEKQAGEYAVDESSQTWTTRSRTTGTETIGTDSETGGRATVRDTATETGSLTSHSRTETQSVEVRTADHAASAEAVRKALVDRQEGLRSRREEVEADLALLGDGGDADVAERRVALERDVADLKAQESAAGEQAASVDERNYAALAAEHGVGVEGATSSTGSSTSSKGSFEHDLGQGRISVSESSTTKDWDTDGSESTTESESRHVQVGAGQVTFARAKGTSTTVGVGDDESTSGSSQEARRGLVLKDDETGVSFGNTEVNEDARSKTSTTSDTQVTTKGITHDHGVEHTRKGKEATGTVKASLKGGVTLEVKRVPGATDAPYLLVLTVSAGGSVGGAVNSVENEGDVGKGSVEAGGGVSGSLTFTHAMGKDEAERYMVSLDKAHQGDGGSLPEFGLVSRLIAAGANLDGAGTAALAAVSSDAARGMGAGDALTLSLTGELSGKASGGGEKGGYGAGVEVGGSAKATRDVTIKPVVIDGQRRVAVTVKFGGETAWNAKGSASAVGAEVSYGHEAAAGGSTSRTFHLDPEGPGYDRVYDRIVGCVTLAELDALASGGDVAEHLYSSTLAEHESSKDSVGGGAFGVTLEVGDHREQSESVTVQGADSTASVSGSQTSSASLGVGGFTVLEGSDKTSMDGEIGADGGVTLTFDSGSSRANVGLPSEVPGPADVVRHGPKKALQDALNDEFERLAGYSVGEEDARALFLRAQDTARWEVASEFQLQTYEDWCSLGRILARPAPASEYAQVDEAKAKDLTRLRALRTFVADHGRGAHVCISNALRRFGEKFGDASSGGARDLGEMWEWPDGLSEHKSAFDGLAEEVPRVVSRVAALSRAGDHEVALGEIEGVRRTLETVTQAVEACDAFVSHRAKLEMLGKLGQYASQLQTAQTGMNAGVDLETCDPVLADWEALDDISRVVSLLHRFHAQETVAIASIQSFMPEEQETTWDSLKAGGRSSLDPFGQARAFGELEDLHEEWIEQIRGLRAMYRAAGTPESAWEVSTGPLQPRNPSLEPNGGEFARLWAANVWDAHDIEARRVKKEAEYLRY